MIGCGDRQPAGSSTVSEIISILWIRNAAIPFPGAHLTLARDGANVPRYGAAARRVAIRIRGREVRQPGRVKEALVQSFLVALCAAAATLAPTLAVAQGGDPKPARSLAATCANCHGTGGVSVGDVESLAGKPREEIVRKMQEFKSGARPSTIMNQLAKGYTDEQIDALAGWFAAQKPSR